MLTRQIMRKNLEEFGARKGWREKEGVSHLAGVAKRTA